MQAIKTLSYQIICILILVTFCNISKADSLPGYTIITTTEIQNSSQKLPDFITHKESVGFDVQVVTETDFGGGTGDEAAENIRDWLQRNYEKYNIEYVLLIGDPRPEISEIPMKIVLPESSESVLTDLYYSDLTGNWDLDGDGYYGEWPDDFGPSGVNRHWDVMVGRIPCYKTEAAQSPYTNSLEHLDNILKKTIRYESHTSSEAEWRKNVLLAMCLGAHTCKRGEVIKNQILDPSGWTCQRVYDTNYDANCPDANPEMTPCTYENVCEIWNSNKFGLAVWFGHGNTVVNPGCLLAPDDPNDAFPTFTFHAACSEADPTSTDNLAYRLLRMENAGAICTLAATAVSGTYPISWNDPAGTPGIMGMAYEYTSRLIAGLTSGQALCGLREKIPLLEWSPGWRNFVIYNIYGDPALQLVALSRRILFVDSDAPGQNDGSSWADAYNNLQDALSSASIGDEIRVAQGTFMPDSDTLNQNDTGDRTATFRLKNGVFIKGGYAGFGEPVPDRRDITIYETILSGEIGVLSTTSDNSYHVVTAGRGTCEATILDGFTIVGANANGDEPNDCGGGINLEVSFVTILNCNITCNSATQGGGMHNKKRSSPTIINCSFISNTASDNGGGIYNTEHSNPKIHNCLFINNSAPNHRGGGMSNIGSSPVLTNCRFTGNSAPWGGGMYNDHESSPLLTRCTFSGNKADRGGAMRCFYGSAQLINCTLTGNKARIEGGGMCNSESGPVLSNCILWANRPDQISGNSNVSFSIVEGGWEGFDSNINDDPNFAMSGYWNPNGTLDNNDDDFWIDGDYHLKSQAGRWDPFSESWIIDSITSPCIDAGDPNTPIGDEPEPNGGIINMGAYGGTVEASKSP